MKHLVFAAGILTTMLSGCSMDFMAIGSSQQQAESEPDPTYRPKEGDWERLYGVHNGTVMDRIPLFKDLTAHDKFMKGLEAIDAIWIADMEEHGELSWTESNSRAALVSIRERPSVFGNAAEVRMIDGSQKNRVAFTSLGYFVRLRPVEQN